jgi:hypothetical protein
MVDGLKVKQMVVEISTSDGVSVKAFSPSTKLA